MEERELRKYKLDFSDCRYLGEIYMHIKKELQLPQWCGENLDALWDAVTGIMYTPVEITIIPHVKRNELQDEVQEIIAVFQEAKQDFDEISVIILEDARD